MAKIHLLSDTVASQVAAGEVIERPSSVAKELVENSMDAGARSIVVEFSRGGTASLIVSDDGCGMGREDALLCLERHATSKIRKSEDLFSVSTLGFRGEAMPSIASISRFHLVTAEHGAVSGTEIHVQGGKLESVKDCGQAPGTRVEVRSLFFNVPARKKFLRAESTESAHLIHQLQVLALANPKIAFTCIKDSREVLRVAGGETLAARIRGLLGAEFFSSLISPPQVLAWEGIEVSGFIGKPGSGRRDRSHQFVFLNGRAISSPAIQSGLREAFQASQEKGMSPPAVLYLRMEPTAFDCNVHPAKREVRFRNNDRVRESVRRFAELTLASLAKPQPIPTLPVQPATTRDNPAPSVAPTQAFAPSQSALFSSSRSTPKAATGKPPAEPLFAPLNLFASRYLMVEKAGNLVIVDLRAATERIIYEQMLRQISSGQPQSQRLLFPELVELQPKDYDWICLRQELLASAGIVIEPFGGGSVKIEALPAILSEIEPKEVLFRAIDALREMGGRPQPRIMENTIARSISALAGKHFREVGMDSAVRLLEDLMRCELPYACPAGRPTMIEWSRSELDRKFGRET